MRAINITGKHNIDKINEIDNKSYKAVRKNMLQIDPDLLINHQRQLETLREIYVLDGTGADGGGDMSSLFKSELIHKIQGYKGQDIKKEIHNADTLINLDNVLEKLVASNLECAYCSKPVFILYKNVREPWQWTLDRIDNDLGHTKENTCISCLKCNLQRRLIDADKFTFTKKLKINKV